MAGIALTGLASGLDTDALVTQLMNVERTPGTQIKLKQVQAQARQDGLKDIQSKVNALNTAAGALKSVTTWGDKQTVSAADPNLVGATLTGGASPGGHVLTVSALARGAQATYGFTSPASDQDISVNGTTVSLTAGASLDDVVSAINSATYPSGTGAYAVNVGGQLAISSRATGAGAQATITGFGGALTSSAGTNAQGTIDGNAFSSQSNVVTTALPGVSMTLKGVTTGTTVSVSPPGVDKDAVVKATKSFVDAYNAVVDSTRSAITEKRVPGAKTGADAATGALFGDNGLRDMLGKLRQAVNGQFGNGGDAIRTADALGISTGSASLVLNQDSVAGKLSFDETKLRKALDDDPDSVAKAFGSDLAGTPAAQGFAQSMQNLLKPLTQTGGVFDGRVEAATSQLSTLQTSLDKFETRMTTKEASLRKMFASLETALQKNKDSLTSLQSALGLSS